MIAAAVWRRSTEKGTFMIEEKGDLEEVIEKYQNLIAENPHSPEHHKELGNAFHRSGAYDLALEEYRTCLHIDPNYYPAQYNMGNTYFAMDECQLAVIAWQRALIAHPKLEHAVYNIAYTYFKQGMLERRSEEARRRYLDDALMEFLKASRMRPQNKDTLLHIGLTWYELDHYDNAIKAYQEVLKIDPEDQDAHYNLGNVYYEKGMEDPIFFEKAIAQYRRALQCNPSDMKSHNNIADCLLRLGQVDKAKSEIDKVLKVDPNYAPAICTLSELHSHEGCHQEAIAGFKRIVALDPEKNHVLHKYASQKLIEEYTRLLKTSIDRTEVRFELGLAYKDLGIAYHDRVLIGKARDEFRKALEIGPAQVEFHIELAECYLKLNNTDLALMEAEAALAMSPDSVQGHCLLGEIYVQVGDRELAQLEFNAIRRIVSSPGGQAHPYDQDEPDLEG